MPFLLYSFYLIDFRSVVYASLKATSRPHVTSKAARYAKHFQLPSNSNNKYTCGLIELIGIAEEIIFANAIEIPLHLTHSQLTKQLFTLLHIFVDTMSCIVPIEC